MVSNNFIILYTWTEYLFAVKLKMFHWGKLKKFIRFILPLHKNMQVQVLPVVLKKEAQA
jgi:hypothetical protein